MKSNKEKTEQKQDNKKPTLNIQYGHRVIFKAMGFTSEELSLPRIAVVNSWSEQSPGHVHLRAVSEGVKAGIRMAGGMPFEINVIGPCTVLGGDFSDMSYDLPQREVILSSIESALHVGWCEGWVGIGSCDKIVPGMLLAALRLNRPFIFIGGGQMLPSDYEGERLGFVRGMEIITGELNKLNDSRLLPEDYERELEEITDCCGSSAGAWPEGALAILKGNLAPRGAVTRHTVVDNKELLKKVFTARVFDSLQEVMEAVQAGKLKPGDALVCRYQGPRGGPAMTECLAIIGALRMKGVKDVAVITDGRFSGWTKGYLAIGNVCPEAQVGGPLALLQDGDPIRVNVPNRKLEAEISEEEMKRRRSKWTPPDQSKVTGILAMYAKTALQADQGAGWPVRMSDFDGP
jgi:dihydroxyacid dehydratase/phosphogluconate dehydratase